MNAFGTATKNLADALNGSVIWQVVDIMSALFIMGIGCLALSLVAICVLDRLQKSDAIRRNYPVIGRFRGLFTTLGEFFRQYFFAMDREELPFNRAQRDWVKHAAEGGSNTLAFGSSRNIAPRAR